MDEITVPDTRNRSRSKTPFTLRSSCDRECVGLGADHIHDKKKSPTKKNPTVETIVEEKDTPVVAQRSTRTKKVQNTSESNTSEAVKQVSTSTEQNSVTKTTTTITTSSKVVKNSSNDKQKEAVKSQTKSSKTTKESSQNESNLLFEQAAKLKTSTPRSVKLNTSGEISINGNGPNLDEHVPFKEYKEAGEYWNKYPKTDYTYSRLSPHRREIRPGIIAMPNMSRRSLDKHAERVVQMAQRDPAKESYFRSRYLSSSLFVKNRTERAADNFYDSQDETDISSRNGKSNRFASYYTTSRNTSQTIIRRFVTLITTIFTTILTSTKNVFRQSNYTKLSSYSHVSNEKGFIQRCSHVAWTKILSIVERIYLGISTVLLWDSWLLKSNDITNKKKKLLLILLLLLLPLFALSAWNLSEESDRQIILHKLPKFIPSITISSLSVVPATVESTLLYLSTINPTRKFRSWLDLNINWFAWWPSNQQHINHITNNIKSSLADHEYSEIINHINKYISVMLNEKLQQQHAEFEAKPISAKMALDIATIVKDHIVRFEYVLNDKDCNRIADIVFSKLREEQVADENGKVFTLTQENLEQITNIIKQQIQLHVLSIPRSTDATDAVPDIDIDGILFKILSSSKLQDVIDQRVTARTSDLSNLINEKAVQIQHLQEEIDAIKLKLDAGLKHNLNIKIMLEQLETKHEDLRDNLDVANKRNDERFAALIKDIDLKLSTISNNKFTGIDDHIKTIIGGILGYQAAGSESLNEIDLRNWIRNLFVAKELLEERLQELDAKFNQQISDEINQSASVLIGTISQKIQSEILLLQKKPSEKLKVSEFNTHALLDEKRITEIVREALAIYDADKTGMVDFALESAGGQILSTRCTESYYTQSAQLSIFGLPLWHKSNTPRTVIMPNVNPGDCWAFQGFPGYLVLQLNSKVYVTGFTMEHIPKSLSSNGRIDSAPKKFTVLGLLSENDQEPFEFGEYEYAENGTSLQYFPVRNVAKNTTPFNIIELRIESNHGHMNYTCLYRFRVHGTLTTGSKITLG